MYKFLERDAETAKTSEVARVVGGKWSGPKARQLKDWLTSSQFPAFGGPMDLDDSYHWELLPFVVSGSRLWVVVE